MPRRYIKVYEVPPPGESIAIGDLDDRQPIAAGDVPAAEWDVEREDGTPARMTGQQLLDQVTGGTPGTGSAAVAPRRLRLKTPLMVSVSVANPVMRLNLDLGSRSVMVALRRFR